MTVSINTNVGAMIALQNLNKTNMDLEQTQSRINTGLKVSSAKDNGAIYAIAQRMKSDVQAYGAVKNVLDRVSSTVDVGLAAGESVMDLLTQMKEKALAAADASIDTNSRDSYNVDFVALRNQITRIVQNATFNGVNMVNGSTVSMRALANAAGTNLLTVAAENMSLGGGLVTLTAAGQINTRTLATNMIATINTSITNLGLALARMGTGSKALEMHTVFVGKLADALEAGVGNLVDADLAKESARLQALQTKQQLGVQALSIANQAPQAIMSLFR
jgi:flagellin